MISGLELLPGDDNITDDLFPGNFSAVGTIPGTPVSAELLSNTYKLNIVCSKGTYIRTLCHDIGTALGCGATLSSLKRTRAGVYSIDEAFSLNDVLEAILSDSVSDIIQPVDSIFSYYPSVIINDLCVSKAKNGAVFELQKSVDNGRYKIYAPDGEFLLLGDVIDNKVKTIKSFFDV